MQYGVSESAFKRVLSNDVNFSVYLTHKKIRARTQMGVHTRDAEHYPMTIAQGRKLASVVRNGNFGWLIVIADDRMIRFISSAVT